MLNLLMLRINFLKFDKNIIKCCKWTVHQKHTMTLKDIKNTKFHS